MPERVSAAPSQRSKHEASQIARWIAALDRDIKSDERLIARPHAMFPGRARARLAENRSIREVLARGLDPLKTRTFRGRVLMEIRCQPKGHLLGRVYPTTIFPVFIPSVAGHPASKNAQKEVRFATEWHETSKAWRQLTKDTPFHLSNRDNWILEFSDDDGPDERYTHFTIRWMQVLRDRHRPAEVTLEDGQVVVPSISMLCRCGESWLACADLMGALDTNQSRLTVPWVWLG